MVGHDELMHAADLLIVHQRQQRLLDNAHDDYNALVDRYNLLVRAANELTEQNQRLSTQLEQSQRLSNQLSNRIAQMVNEDSRMLAWAEEALLSFRRRYIRHYTGGTDPQAADLETRRTINLWLLGFGVTLYKGLVLAPRYLTQYEPEVRRMARKVENWALTEKARRNGPLDETENDLNRWAREAFENESKQLAEAAHKVGLAEEWVITSQISGDEFRKRVGSDYESVADSNRLGELICEAESARYVWVAPPDTELPLYLLLRDDFLEIGQRQLD